MKFCNLLLLLEEVLGVVVSRTSAVTLFSLGFELGLPLPHPSVSMTDRVSRDRLMSAGGRFSLLARNDFGRPNQAPNGLNFIIIVETFILVTVYDRMSQ